MELGIKPLSRVPWMEQELLLELFKLETTKEAGAVGFSRQRLSGRAGEGLWKKGGSRTLRRWGLFGK